MSEFFCETNCELWYEKAEELEINVIRMPYTIDGVEYYYDLGKNTDFKEFYAKVRNGIIPITSALNPQNYIDYIEPVFARGQDILYVSFSSKMSNTFEHLDNALNQLKEKYPDRKLTRFDTKSISVGAGYQVYYAAKMHKDGKSDEEILEFLTDFQKHVGIYFMVDSLMHLKRGGRISAAAATFGGLLNLKPIIKVDDEGKLVPFIKVAGKRNAIKQMVKTMTKTELDPAYPIMVLDADDSELADFFVELLHDEFGEDLDIWRQPIGPVVGTHCGPGTVGVAYYKRKV